MVKRVLSATALGRTGVADWLIQRVSALIIFLYFSFLVGFYLSHRPLDFTIWHHLFTHTGMKLFSLITLLSLLAHAWVGMWSVLTDYIKCAYFRGTVQVLIIVMFLACLAWGVQIFWSL